MSKDWILILLISSIALLGVTVGFGLISIVKYPGGNKQDQHELGFKFSKNYWCELYRSEGLNGMTNPGMIFAKLATLFGSVGMILFWVAIPFLYIKNHSHRITTQICGSMALLLAGFMFTSGHDLVLFSGSILGGVAMTLLTIHLFKNHRKLFGISLLLVLLVGLNNMVYISNFGITVLPALQKCTFILFVAWSGLFYWDAYKKIRK